MKFFTQILCTFALIIFLQASHAQKEYSIAEPMSDECCNEAQLYYPEKSSLIDTSFCYNWDLEQDEWVPASMTINTYDDEGWKVEELRKHYWSSEEGYVDVSKRSYSYYPDHMVFTNTYQLWNDELNGGSWDNISRYFYYYNENGQMVEQISQSHYFEWFNFNRESYIYDENGYKTEHLTQDWDHNANNWRNKKICYFPPPPTITSVAEIEDDSQELTIAPNPVDDFLNVRKKIVTPGSEVVIQVINMNNQLVHTEKQVDGKFIRLPVRHLKPGVYFVTCNEGKRLFTGRFLKR